MPILSILENIAADTKRSHKISLLEKHKDNQVLLRVINMALNPYINYYIKKIPPYTTTPVCEGVSYTHLDRALDALERLSAREVTGNEAINLLSSTLSSVSADDAVVLTRVIGRDLRCGVAEATVNAVIKGFIPTYPCLLARPYNAANASNIVWPAYSQLKADGVRTNALVKAGKITVCGRSGRNMDLLSVFDQDILSFARAYKECTGVTEDIFIDGELEVVDSSGKVIDRKTGNGIIGKAIRGTISLSEASSIRFQIWDAFPLSEFYAGRSSERYDVRFQRMLDVYDKMQTVNPTKKIVPIAYKVVNNLGEAEEHFQEMLAAGKEGVIIKNYAGVWCDDRSEHLVKMKSEKEADLEVIGYNPGTGQYLGQVGSLVCASSDGKILVSISGFSQELRLWITENIKSVIGKIVTVKYNERIGSKASDRSDTDSLFLPRFVEFRYDKTDADHSTAIQ